MPRIPMSGEPRSERVAVLMTPTTKANLEKIALVNKTSVNMVINNALDNLLKEHQNDIQRYNDFFGEE